MGIDRRVPRSQDAKDRIVVAARSVFTERGYDRATVREIAERAAVVPAMLVRYFGGKAGVFAAAIQFDLALPDIATTDPEEAGRRLVTHFLSRWRRADNGGDLVALLRASVDHAEARERMNAIFTEQLVPAITSTTGERRAGTAAALIASQMLGLAFCRFVLELPTLQTITDEDVVDLIGPTISSYLAPREQA